MGQIRLGYGWYRDKIIFSARVSKLLVREKIKLSDS